MQGYCSCHSETDKRNLNLSDWNKKNPMFKQYQIWILYLQFVTCFGWLLLYFQIITVHYLLKPYQVAVKRLSFDGVSRHTAAHLQRGFLREVFVLNSIIHPNIVRLIGCCSEESERLLVYEYIYWGSLRKNLTGQFSHPCTLLCYLCILQLYKLIRLGCLCT